MERRVLGKIDPGMEQLFLDILDNALGDIFELESDPTTASGELKVNQIAWNPNTSKFFINLGGTTYSLPLTAV